MSLIYLFLISPRYYKPINSVKFNPILLLLLLSLYKNNNNCNSTRFSSSKVKNDTSTADTNCKAYNKNKHNTINNHNSNTTYNNGCDFDTINTNAYINRKINHKKSTFKSTNKLTTTPEDISKNDLIDYNNTLFKSYDLSNTSNDIIDETINNTTDIKHNINNLNSDNICGTNITDTTSYENRKSSNDKSLFKSTAPYADINIDNLAYYSDELFKSFDSLDTNNDIVDENINNTTDDNLNINNLNSDCICDADITDTDAYVNKKINSESSSLKSSNKLATASEDINTSDLIDFNDNSFKSSDSLNTKNDTTDSIEKNINNHNDINPSVDHLNSDYIHNSDIIDTKDCLDKESNNKKSILKSPNKLTTTSEDINTSALIDFNDKSFKSSDSLNTRNDTTDSIEKNINNHNDINPSVDHLNSDYIPNLDIIDTKDCLDKESNTENIEDNNTNHNTDDFVSNCQCNTTNKSNLNKITSTIKHIDNSTHINSCYLSTKANYDTFNISEDINRTFKLPTLLIKCDISDSFKGDINFCNYIASINDIKNKLVITSNLLLLDVTKRDTGTLFLDGYLETDIDYSIPLELKVPLICKHSNLVLRSPLNISVPIELQYTVPSEENAFSDLDLSLVKSSFNIKTDLCEDLLLEDCISVYKGCELTIIANYYIEVFKNEVFHY
ncbi:hypothetical protein [Clostridium sardiniense]|uniref:hypothetical protein n=1 Tax=Clostridium sardiniense TaxID=29369 RepID=UPI003D34D12F